MDVFMALGLTFFAGLATGVGSIIAFFASKANYRFLSLSTGFSGGVMLYVAFVEILPKGGEAIAAAYGAAGGRWLSALAFFGGMALIAIIDNLVPSAGNPHETHSHEEIEPLHNAAAALPDFQAIADNPAAAKPGAHDHRVAPDKLLRMGLLTALAIGVHNFPEGLATFLAALDSPGLGVSIAVAVALHNIPEGISVAVPIYYATGNRKKAFVYSLLSGIAEPAGALAAYLLLCLALGQSSIPPQIMGILFAAVAGIMVYISLDELLPTSRAYGQGHDAIAGLVAGMIAMELSLLLMKME